MRKSTGSAASRPLTTTNAAASDKKHSFAKQDLAPNKSSGGVSLSLFHQGHLDVANMIPLRLDCKMTMRVQNAKTDVNTRKGASSRYGKGNKASYDEFSASAKLNAITPSTTAGLPTTATQK